MEKTAYIKKSYRFCKTIRGRPNLFERRCRKFEKESKEKKLSKSKFGLGVGLHLEMEGSIQKGLAYYIKRIL